MEVHCTSCGEDNERAADRDGRNPSLFRNVRPESAWDSNLFEKTDYLSRRAGSDPTKLLPARVFNPCGRSSRGDPSSFPLIKTDAAGALRQSLKTRRSPNGVMIVVISAISTTEE